ncbi:hypothetical protein F7725_007890 [Dissostichus mawsoni]|uniref:Uncharacterized protein n=1 Tax=Dissostichus mawsoni TaxID=36200 RepID=A0A7J5Y7V7_DISMA|nr:hypothetical protein F7725_007890 [Dissostichus mawsoni]
MNTAGLKSPSLISLCSSCPVSPSGRLRAPAAGHSPPRTPASSGPSQTGTGSGEHIDLGQGPLRPCALSSRLVRSLSRSSTSRNRKKTSLHSGWVSNNLLPRQPQCKPSHPATAISDRPWWLFKPGNGYPYFHMKLSDEPPRPFRAGAGFRQFNHAASNQSDSQSPAERPAITHAARIHGSSSRCKVVLCLHSYEKVRHRVILTADQKTLCTPPHLLGPRDSKH